MTNEVVRVEIKKDIATLTLCEPDSRNALSVEMVGQFGGALKALAAPEKKVRCLVIAAEGKAFSSGGSLKGAPTPEERAKTGGSLLQDYYHPLFRRLRDFRAPIVTSVNGAAAGAGMSLALMGDIIVTARSAFFLQAFRNIGVVPDCGSSWLLPRLIGSARAREMSLLGERIPAETAFAWGMVNRLVDDADLHTETYKIAEQLASGPIKSLGAIRKLYWESNGNSFEEQINLEDRFQEAAVAGPEAAEGKAAFLEKRQPDFRKIITD